MVYNYIISKNIEGITPVAWEIINRKSENFNINFRDLTHAEFRSHFVKSRQSIEQACLGLKGRIVVLGCGGANDFDLKGLVEQFDEVFLLDLNPVLVQRAIENKVPKSHHHKITISQIDISGIFSKLTQDIEKIALESKKDNFDFNLHMWFLSQNMDPFSASTQSKSTVGYLWNSFYEIFFNSTKPFGLDKESASFVVCSMVTSELSTFISEYIQTVYKKAYSTDEQITFKYGFWVYLDHLAAQQIGYMQMLLKPEGILYFSDTFAAGFPRDKTPTADAMLNKLSENNIVKAKKWSWQCGMNLEIQAFYVQKSNPNSIHMNDNLEEQEVL